MISPLAYQGHQVHTYVHWVGVTSQGWSEGWLTLRAFAKNRVQMGANIQPVFFTFVGSLVEGALPHPLNLGLCRLPIPKSGCFQNGVSK